MDKPFVPAAARNQDAILAVLRVRLAACVRVLEVAAGSGQHAVRFAAALPHLSWQPTDLAAALPGIEAWRREAALPNLRPALALDVRERPWAQRGFDAVYAANLAHFVHGDDLEALFAGVAGALERNGLFLLYGPFHFRGEAVSAGNRQLDAWLATLDAGFAIREFDLLDRLAGQHGLQLCEDCPLPANNHLLVWRLID